YFTIVIAAILPAILYFTGIFMMVHFEGKRLGLRGLPKESLPNFFKLLLQNGYMLLPIFVLVICMNHYTAGMSACFAILFSLIVSLIDKPALRRIVKGKMESGRDILSAVMPLIPLVVLVVLWKVIALNMGVSIFFAMVSAAVCTFFVKDATLTTEVLLEGLEGGTNNSIGVSTACGIAGIISGVVTMTTLGSTLITVIVPIAQKGKLLALFLTMICCIVLGMGVPTTANYVIMATITAPILIKMGIPTLAAHMFVFYFGIVADITPPVALAAYAGAAIAKSNPLQTGIQATKLAITAFIVPYIFAYSPSMLLVVEGYEASVFQVISIFITSIIGIYAISSGMEGFMHHHEPIWQRILLIGAGLCMIIPEPITDIIGIAVVALIIFLQYVVEKKRMNPTT
ncbi:MAG: TRAP transporter large permease subunit, partial [Clostridia bacterium]|nr:TRAP transporter large permease subunit [Clostridia bacterium]